MKAEYPENRSCPQKDSAEHEEYVGVQSVGSREIGEQDGADLLERILSRDNLSRAYKRVRANHGAPGIDGMTIDAALLWLREHLIFGILSCILYNNAKYIVCWR